MNVKHSGESSQSSQQKNPAPKRKVAILVSGSGSNLQAFIDAWPQHPEASQLALVLCNRPNAPALARAEKAQIPTVVIDHTLFEDRAEFDESINKTLQDRGIDCVVLAGFMRILGPSFMSHWIGRMINIHPSLLPKYRGLHTHKRVLEDKQSTHGCSVHWVVPELDAGPVISQASLDVEPQDTADSLQDRVQALEHKLYPMTLDYILNELELPYPIAVNSNKPLLKCLDGESLDNYWSTWQSTGVPFSDTPVKS